MVTRRECDLCKQGIEAEVQSVKDRIRDSTILIGIFISILGVLIKVKVI